ncbi:hypothetical protein B7P43_G03387 [Cryptotermes secundus]|uniref:Uncharacterized protein n=1 Tax=Cryptotermes secundus TaxID=105785 RepID=A0A2J7QDQ3_9NEOP|nr:hypothetical protein B7P43_G03387 [Cryptotermes secundus]
MSIDLKPKALSTTDPMWQDFDDDGFNGLSPYFARNEFAIMAEGFVAASERLYDLMISADQNFQKCISISMNVSPSMFVLYCVQHLYGRSITVRTHQDLNSYPEMRFLDYIRSDNYPVPAPIEEFLRCIGNVKDQTGVDYKLAFPIWPNNEGDFGRVDEVSHTHYESLPAPVVCAERIRQDLVYTIHPQVNPNWNLPLELQREEEHCGLLTKNLSGWGRAAVLTTEQRSTLEGAGVKLKNQDENFVCSAIFDGMLSRTRRKYIKYIKFCSDIDQHTRCLRTI